MLQEFEAHFHPVQAGSNIRGKSAWKYYVDGTYRFKLSLSEIPLPDCSYADLQREGQRIMRLAVHNRRVKVDIENGSPWGVPAMEAGQSLQVRSGDSLLAESRYKAEYDCGCPLHPGTQERKSRIRMPVLFMQAHNHQSKTRPSIGPRF